MDRNYSKEIEITLTWGEWNVISLLVGKGMRTEENERHRDLRRKLSTKINESAPDNEWPDSMKEAHDEAVKNIMENSRGGDEKG